MRYFDFQRHAMRFFYGSILLVMLVSCIPNKKVLLLQGKDVNAKNLKTDSLMRGYDIQDIQYTIQTEDVISVRIESLTPQEFDIYNRPGASASQSGGGGQTGGQTGTLLLGDIVDHHGEIPFILTGKTKVAGLTIYQIQDTLQKVANQYLKSPIVRVRLLNYRVTVLGEVAKEGVVTINNNRISIIETVGLAGGMGELADRENIKLIRQHNGRADVYYINLLQEKLFTSPLYYSQQNDIIVVPPLRQRTYRKYFLQNLALFLSTLSIVFVIVNYTNK